VSLADHPTLAAAISVAAGASEVSRIPAAPKPGP
jgi:hypothetical protein